jgi:hypothetical protein
MSLKALVKSMVKVALDITGDLKTTVVYRRVVSAYNPAVGAVTTTVTTVSLIGVLYSYESDQIDNKTVFATDKQFLFEADLIDFEPSLNDEVLISTSTWQVQGKTKDPAGATWILQLRLP